MSVDMNMCALPNSLMLYLHQDCMFSQFFLNIWLDLWLMSVKPALFQNQPIYWSDMVWWWRVHVHVVRALLRHWAPDWNLAVKLFSGRNSRACCLVVVCLHVKSLRSTELWLKVHECYFFLNIFTLQYKLCSQFRYWVLHKVDQDYTCNWLHACTCMWVIPPGWDPALSHGVLVT